MQVPVYLDNHATTRVDDRVLETMLPYFSEVYGNAASKQHEFGWKASAAVEVARKQVGGLIGASEGEIVFTSGATESINLALKGAVEAHGGTGHIITAGTEHRAGLDVCQHLDRSGVSVTYLPVDANGLISLDDLERQITDETVLVSIMAVNNEIGTIHPLDEIGKLCKDRRVLFHTDATQAVGRIPVDVRSACADLLSFSSHKMYGPKGVGALYVRSSVPKVRIVHQIDGGGHERGLRSGTLNVPGIVGFGKACALAGEGLLGEMERIQALCGRLVSGLMSGIDGARLNGHPELRVPGNASMTFPGVRAEQMMMEMKDIAVSTGSACSSHVPQPSHVLKAIGLSRDEILSTIRFGLGRFTTSEEIDYAIHRIVETVQRLRTVLQPA